MVLGPLHRSFSENGIAYDYVGVEIDRTQRTANIGIRTPKDGAPANGDAAQAQGDAFWPLQLARELDDAILHLRLNEPTLASWVLRTEGDPERVVEYDAFLRANQNHWLVREVTLFWKRVMKRLDTTSRTLFTLIEPGSCFSGFLAEIAFAADRSYMLDAVFEGDNRKPAAIRLTESNFGLYPMGNGLTRLETRFLGEPESVEKARGLIGEEIDDADSEAAGLVPAAPDYMAWDDEIRLAIEERASFSPDALTGMEANLRFAGPETMETKIFGRLTAWQNWIFQRPNAVGESGALKLYGTGKQADYNQERV